MPYAVIIWRWNGVTEQNIQPKKPTLEQLQKAVGGYIETVPYLTKAWPYKRGRAFANENGVMEGLPHNNAASLVWRMNCEHSTGLCGNVIYYAKVKA